MAVELEHGKSYISVNTDIITIKAVGAFNIEGMIKTIEELKSVITSFNQTKFKLLFDYLEVEGGTPDALDKANELNTWLNGQNMVAKATVIKSSIHLAILQSRTPAINIQNTKSFDDKESAMNWLESQS